MDERERLIGEIADPELIRYFYLDVPSDTLVAKLDSLTLTLTAKQDDVPFNAQVKGYFGAVDNDGDPWLLKPATDPKEIYYHRICTLAYIIDHWLGTISSPTTVIEIGEKKYRASKTVQNAVQISSYNYLERPYIEFLRTDLINRWLFFDEDRNPNNYLIIHNSKNKPFLVAIDFDKADLESPIMKILGMPDKFGWIRKERTRFLTLLRPDNFESVPLEVFLPRLNALEAIDEGTLRRVCADLTTGYCENPIASAKLLADNIIERRGYIGAYFKKMFKHQKEMASRSNSEDYSMLGKSFLAMYDNKD